MSKLQALKRNLRPGEVYRRRDLEKWSKSVDRHLQQLVTDGTLEKLSGGLYYVPKQTVFGKAPANDKELITSFLKDTNFLLTSYNDYNTLGVGTTQLYNAKRVYNTKRHGQFKLGNRVFNFVRKPYVPLKVTDEFLLVDLVNNINELAEDRDVVLEKVKEKTKGMDARRLKALVNRFGKVATVKFFNPLLA
ncbi:hypothetical protein [Niabella beijingensis]|uniref:hypothetical protein n=1 Tax=Niabella beijingensis TaxID=2872700 RepID=UPI001CBD7D4B|nr:hypothetical protein [Niabella beijingensis]